DEEKKAPSNKWREWMLVGSKKLKGNKGIRTPPEVAKLKKLYRDNSKAAAPMGHWWNGRLLSYVEARKQIYLPLYAQLVQKTQAYQELHRLCMLPKQQIMLLDLDGPSLETYPQGCRMTPSLLYSMLLNTSRPFGHG